MDTIKWQEKYINIYEDAKKINSQLGVANLRLLYRLGGGLELHLGLIGKIPSVCSTETPRVSTAGPCSECGGVNTVGKSQGLRHSRDGVLQTVRGRRKRVV